MDTSDAECPPEAEAKAVAARLRKLREGLGKSNKAMAALMDVSEGNYSEFESGQRRVSLNTALRLYERLNISLDWIYLGRPDREPRLPRPSKAEQPKRKLGRPKGSKNKPKNPPVNGDPYRFL